MTRTLVVALMFATSYCDRIDRPRYGGDSERALVEATVANDAAKVEQLLAAGANPNTMIDYQGSSQSAWWLALRQFRPKHPEQVAIIKSLVKHGANAEAAWGTTSGTSTRAPRTESLPPIQLAMLYPDPQVIQAILESKPDAEGGRMALVMAIETGQTEIAHLLVEAGVDVNCQPSANTPLVAAIEARDEAMMNYLEAHGAREKP